LRIIRVTSRVVNRTLVLVLVGLCLAAGVSACGGSGGSGRYNNSGQGAGQLDRTPEKLDGSQSFEFENDDIERADKASEAVMYSFPSPAIIPSP
jgi:hypothetical protein